MLGGGKGVEMGEIGGEVRWKEGGWGVAQSE